jgi:hypothetical protein
MRTKRGIKIVPSRSSRADPNARTTRSIAEKFDSCTSYVQQVRNGVAQVALDVQNTTLQSLTPAPTKSAVLEVLFDETEIKVPRVYVGQ